MPDTMLALTVVERLREERRVSRARFMVGVRNSVVVLEGRSASAQVRDRASAVTWATPGVVDVCDRPTAPEGPARS